MRTRIRIEGTVQGVGFRPFVHSLATRYGLGGLVGNDASGVFIEVEGAHATISAFRAALWTEAPPLAVIEKITERPVADIGDSAFVIAPSERGGLLRTPISADTATCADCLRELADPACRRYRYPFVNCTNCGPRFTIVTGVPYDRPFTTMAAFAMCADCAREYADPGDRRYHAQPVCCPACGPELVLTGPGGIRFPGDPIVQAAALLRGGGIAAVKGLGGYHLAADARSATAVAALRARKHRAEKPFALMVPDLAAARRLCELSGDEERALASSRRPIVMLTRRPGTQVAPAVAPHNRYLGLMLPYTPLHHLLLAALGRPIVLTSGNVSDEPIAFTDADAAARLAPIADAFLTHNRPIHVRTDDSVVRVRRGREYPVRRSRGYAPAPLRVAPGFRRPVLACGAELKSTFCLGKGEYAILSHHIGDLGNYETYRSFTGGIAHFRRLFGLDPELVAHDLHPDYLSTRYARELDGVDRIGVQHHHAHVASCLADNGEAGLVIGVAFDGTGYGPDGTIWGGEFLVADLLGYTRHGRLAPVPMPGGAAAIAEPWRMTASYLDGAAPAVRARNAGRWDAVVQLARSGTNSPLTSSAGRLFDAVAALAGARDEISYEGQAAIELEQLADPREPGTYPVPITDGVADGDPVFEVRGDDLIHTIADELSRGTEPRIAAMRFHRALAGAIAAGAHRIREATGLCTVALSGGVFQNVLLLDLTTDLLEARGFRVLTHHRVPTNDGGISLGQAAIAAAADRS